MLYQQDVLYAAFSNPDRTVNLHVSLDNGYSFRQLEFFSDLRETRYTILDNHEHVTFIDVDHGFPGVVSLMVSDRNHEDFTLSLARHHSDGQQVDYSRARGIDGIHFVNVVNVEGNQH